MSEQQTQRGKFKKIDLQGKTIEKWCEEQCIDQGKTKKWEDETWKEFFFDMYWDKYFIINGEIYQILKVEDVDNCYYVQIDKQDDDTYQFYATYYDGGTCLTECLEDGLSNINK